MEIKYLLENTNPQNSDWLLTENETAAQKLSVGNLLALAGTPTDLSIEDISGLQASLDNKADKSDISTLSSVVTTKANQSTVDALTTAVSGKIDKSLVEITNPSANDFLILEKVSDNSNKKIKLSAISSSSSGIITSSTVPNNPTIGLIWNELDNNGALIETWSYTNSRWRSAYKNLHTRNIGSGGGSVNINDGFGFDDRYDIWLDKAIIKVSTFIALNPTNYLTWYFLRSNFSTVGQITINNLAVNANYTNIFEINQTYSFSTANNNLNLFIQRMSFTGGSYNFHSTTNFSYRFIRK